MVWMQWKPYVPVARRRTNALREMTALRKSGKAIQPVQVEGRAIARTFWGKGWCDHLESFSDYENRLPRGRTYVRNGSVCHLAVQPGRIEAIVSGSELYNIRIEVQKLKPAVWKSVKKNCAGRIGSMLELLQGKLSDQVMTVVSDRMQGLFPQPNEIKLACSCPDWAVMCKHVAAALYGVGRRLDEQPEMLFLLRGVDAQELIAAEIALPASVASGDRLDDDRIGDIFGIDLDESSEPRQASEPEPKKRGRARKRTASTATSMNGRAVPPKQSAPAASRSNGFTKQAQQAVVRKIRALPQSNGRARAGAVGDIDAAARKIRPTGKSMARLRRQLGLSMADFARRLGVAAATVNRWETAPGRLELKPRPLAALAELQQQIPSKSAR